MYTDDIERASYMSGSTYGRGWKYTAAMAPMTEHPARIADVRNSFADATGRARYSDEPTILTSHSKRVAFIGSMDMYEWTRAVAAALVDAAADPAKADALKAAGIDVMTELVKGKTLLAQAQHYRAEAN